MANSGQFFPPLFLLIRVKMWSKALSFCFISESLGDFPIDPFGKRVNDAISQDYVVINIVNQTIIHCWTEILVPVSFPLGPDSIPKEGLAWHKIMSWAEMGTGLKKRAILCYDAENGMAQRMDCPTQWFLLHTRQKIFLPKHWWA